MQTENVKKKHNDRFTEKADAIQKTQKLKSILRG